MVMTSDQIAQAHGTYQGAAMGNMMYSGMIGSPYDGMTSGEAFTGRAMNVAGAIGGPASMAGLAMMGKDPFSMGVTGALAARGAGAGAMAGAGLAGAAGVGIPLMAAQWGAGQIYQGAQNQQMLNTSMRQNYSFRNQFGGQGFTGGQLGEMGQSLYGMAGDVGPMGETTSFQELGRLASNMGRMGMAQGVRDAKDFTDKFREMVKTLKTIATEMGTSLEEAQKMMAGMKSMGVFRQGDAKRMAGMIGRGTAAGLATPELTGMGAIGSQISRMVGGRGAAGAEAGIQAMTNIGAAVQAGVLTEEDIYNTTGQTGAAGRRAFATAQLQGSARFLRRGVGRRFLASVAGPDGSVNMDAVEEIMEGGVSTARTMQLAHQNLRGVGRANFIRNEGKIRGEVMRQFGGLAPVIGMKGWLGERGINVNEDNDRAMLFLQRRLGMGTDEAESMVKMAQNLPQILEQRQQNIREEGWSRGAAEARKGQGLEGIKRKFDRALSDINNSMQSVGAEWSTNVSNMVDRWANQLTGNTVQEYRGDLMKAFQAATTGGDIGAQRLAGFTTGQDYMSQVTGTGPGVRGGTSDYEFARDFTKGPDIERFTEAGYTVSSWAYRYDPGSVRKQVGRARRMSTAMRRGGPAIGLGGSLKANYRAAISSGTISGGGDNRVGSLQAFLWDQAGRGDKEALSLANRLNNADDEGKMTIISGLNKGAGITGEVSRYTAPSLIGQFDKSKFSTVRDRNEAIGLAALGADDTDWEATRAIKGFINRSIGTDIGLEETSGAGIAAGAFYGSEAGRELVRGVTSGDERTRLAARERVENRMLALTRAGDELSGAGRGELGAMRGMLAYGKVADVYKAAGVTRFEDLPAASRQELERAASAVGMTTEGYVQSAGAFQAHVRGRKMEGIENLAAFGVEARRNLTEMAAGGDSLKALTTGEDAMSQELKDELNAAGLPEAAINFVNSTIEQQKSMARIYKGMEEGEYTEVEASMLSHGKAAGEQLDILTTEEKKKTTDILRGYSGSAIARQRATRAKRVEKSLFRAASKYGGGRVGRVRGLADVLGISVGKKEVSEAMSGSEANMKELVTKFADELGIGSDAAHAKIQEIIEASATGKEGRQRISGTLLDELKSVKGFKEAQDQRDKQKGEASMSYYEKQMVGHTQKMETYLGALVSHARDPEAKDPEAKEGHKYYK